MKEQYRIISNANHEILQAQVNELMYFSDEKWAPSGGLVVTPSGMLLQPMAVVQN